MATEHVLSPLPGTFYRRPTADDPPYKSEGDRVVEGEVIGLVEVMKSFYEVKAEISGVIVAFLVENEGAIMAGQPVAQVDANK